MDKANQKAVIALKALNKIPEIREKYLAGVDFKGLSEEESLRLLNDCRKMEHELSKEQSDSKIRFMANYQKPDNTWATVFLTDTELAEIEENQRKEMQRIWKQCLKDANGNKEIACTFLKMRCHKPYTLVKQALSYKVFKIRNAKQT